MTTRRDLLQSSLSAGELSEDLAAREDVEAYFQGAQILNRFFPKLTAGAEKSPGFMDLAPAHILEKRSRLVPFVFSRDDVAYLEFSDMTLVVRDRDTAEPIVIIDTPYPSEDVDGIRFFQSADVVFLVHASNRYPPHALKRFATDDWQLDPWQINDGPWLPPNDVDWITLQVSAIEKGEEVTVTAAITEPPDDLDPDFELQVFDPAHVGAVFRIGTPQAYFSGDAWQQEKEYTAGQQIVSDGNVYEALNAGTSGFNQPLHGEGAVSDGESGVEWLFLHDGAGNVRITEVISPTEARAIVERQLPSTEPTQYWSEGAFSDFRGWPAAGAIHDERIFFGSTQFQPDTVFLSRVSDYDPFKANFRPGSGFDVLTDSDAVTRTLADGTVNPIHWAVSHARLFTGTTAAIKRISGPTIDEPITPNPGGAVARTVTTVGSANIAPGVLQDAIIYASPDGSRVLEHVMQETERDPRDLTIRADQVGFSRVVEFATVRWPDKRVFMRRADGSLYCLTYDRREGFVAFNRMTLAGNAKVESIISAPGPDGFDDLVMIIERRSTRRIYRLARSWLPAKNLPEEQMYLDGAQIFDFWNRNPERRIQVQAGKCDESIIISGPSGWLVDAEIGKEVWWRSDRASSLDPDSLTVFRGEIEAIEGNAATVFLLGDVDAMATDAFALPQEQIIMEGRSPGETLSLFCDGLSFGTELLQTGNIIDLGVPCAYVICGDFYEAKIRSMPLSTPTPLGASRGERQTLEKMHVVLRDTAGGIAQLINDLGEINQSEALVRIEDNVQLGEGQLPRSVNKTFPLPNPWSNQIAIEIVSDFPGAMTLLGIKASVTVNEGSS